MADKYFVQNGDAILCLSKLRYKKYLRSMIAHKLGKGDRPDLSDAKIITLKVINLQSFELDDAVEILKKKLAELL